MAANVFSACYHEGAAHWCAWHSERDLHWGLPFARGTTATLADAVRQARRAAPKGRRLPRRVAQRVLARPASWLYDVWHRPGDAERALARGRYPERFPPAPHGVPAGGHAAGGGGSENPHDTKSAARAGGG